MIHRQNAAFRKNDDREDHGHIEATAQREKRQGDNATGKYGPHHGVESFNERQHSAGAA